LLSVPRPVTLQLFPHLNIVAVCAAAGREDPLSLHQRRIRGAAVDPGAGQRDEAPWGGYKQSAIGRELGKWGAEEYMNVKQVYINLSEQPIGWY
jgi:hypothetical protein